MDQYLPMQHKFTLYGRLLWLPHSLYSSMNSYLGSKPYDSFPELYNAVYSVLLWNHVELHGDEYQDTNLELFAWVYMYRAARQQTHK